MRSLPWTQVWTSWCESSARSLGTTGKFCDCSRFTLRLFRCATGLRFLLCLKVMWETSDWRNNATSCFYKADQSPEAAAAFQKRALVHFTKMEGWLAQHGLSCARVCCVLLLCGISFKHHYIPCLPRFLRATCQKLSSLQETR